MDLELIRKRAEVLLATGWCSADIETVEQAMVLVEYAEALGLHSMLAASQLVVSKFYNKKERRHQVTIYARYPQLVAAMRRLGYVINEVPGSRRNENFKDLFVKMTVTHPSFNGQVNEVTYSTKDFERDGWPKFKKAETIDGVLTGRAIRRIVSKYAADALGGLAVYDESEREHIEGKPEGETSATDELNRAAAATVKALLHPEVKQMIQDKAQETPPEAPPATEYNKPWKDGPSSSDMPSAPPEPPPEAPAGPPMSKAETEKAFRRNALRDWIRGQQMTYDDERRLLGMLCTRDNVRSIDDVSAKTLVSVLQWLANTNAEDTSKIVRKSDLPPESFGRILEVK